MRPAHDMHRDPSAVWRERRTSRVEIADPSWIPDNVEIIEIVDPERPFAPARRNESDALRVRGNRDVFFVAGTGNLRLLSRRQIGQGELRRLSRSRVNEARAIHGHVRLHFGAGAHGEANAASAVDRSPPNGGRVLAVRE